VHGLYWPSLLFPGGNVKRIDENKRLCGLDEAGRGALAGPLVAAAVILPKRVHCKLRDGKLLNPNQRQKVYSVLKKLKAEIFIEVISTRSINNHGIGWANREIFRRLIKRIDSDRYIVDGNLRLGRIAGKTKKVASIVDADATIPEVISAGIVAKVERDKIMTGLHKEFPHFGWKNNAGYGTSAHILAIHKYNTTRFHRGIFVTTAIKRLFGRLEGAHPENRSRSVD
jgi:ribonuclease HII